jgi:ribosome-associated toxin RatA of RatAB toxin-antitoxin module
MTQTPVHSLDQSILVEATPEALYDLVSDITRTGEWSPICTACWWDDTSEAGRVGAWFTGHNELPERTWETRSQIVAADRGREFAWIVGDGFVRWSFTFEPDGAATRLTESWAFLPNGIAMFQEKYGDRATVEIDERTQQAHDGIPRTLAAIKRVAESS